MEMSGRSSDNRARYLTGRIAFIVRDMVPRKWHGIHKTATHRASEERERIAELRSHAERLSCELLAEREPDYAPDEQNIARLEQAFSDQHRHREQPTL